MPQKRFIMNSPCFTRFSIFFCCVFTMATVIFKIPQRHLQKAALWMHMRIASDFPSIMSVLLETCVRGWLAGHTHSSGLWRAEWRHWEVHDVRGVTVSLSVKLASSTFQKLKNRNNLPPGFQSCCVILRSHRLCMSAQFLCFLSNMLVFSAFFVCLFPCFIY